MDYLLLLGREIGDGPNRSNLGEQRRLVVALSSVELAVCPIDSVGQSRFMEFLLFTAG